MSKLDFSNMQVLFNFLKSQMLEDKGEFARKESVLVFKTEDGTEFLVPEEWEDEVDPVKRAEREAAALAEASGEEEVSSEEEVSTETTSIE